MQSTNIKGLFDAGNRKFRIPSYQRSYSWGEKQVTQFIEDLKNAQRQYYLGHFLFEEEEGENENTLLIIDGQQRLTTCVIFFSCLKNELKKRKNQNETIDVDLDDITDYYLKDIHKGIQKFETVADDNNFFLNEIIDSKQNTNDTTTKSQLRIRKAKLFFEKEFEKTETKELERWTELVENAAITQFVVEDKVQAAQIFAFQNDRGKALSKLEIVKSYFMLQIYLLAERKEQANEHIKFLEREFSTIYSQTVRINLKEDDVLTYYWCSIKGYSYDKITDGVKEALQETPGNKIDWIKGIVTGLSQAFNTVEKIEQSTDSYISDLRSLNNMALSYPFFMKAYRVGASEKTISRIAKFLENITFRSLLRGGRADIESRLNSFLTKKFEDDNQINNSIDTMINRIKTDGWWGYWNDNELLRLLDDGWFYQNRVDNYVLWKYELYLCNKNYPLPHKVSFNDLIRNESIEHIAPQMPTNGNPLANGYGKYKDAENGIKSGHWLHCLGNLMLISQSHNSSIGNQPFVNKLDSYGKDNLLHQQKEIQDFVEDKNNPVWDVAAINRRHEKILKAAQEIWNLDKI